MLILAAAAHIVVDQTPLPIAVDSLPQDSPWFIASTIFAALAAISTTGLALLTRGLAIATRDMAQKTADLASETAVQVKETTTALEQTERHHQQSLMPIVSHSLDCRLSRGSDTNLYLLLNGDVNNVGPGPATNVCLYIHPSAYVTQKLYLGVISANDKTTLSNRLINLGQLDQAITEGVPYDSLLRYDTIFETEGAMRQSSYSGYGRDAVIQKHIVPSNESRTEIDDIALRDSLKA